MRLLRLLILFIATFLIHSCRSQQQALSADAPIQNCSDLHASFSRDIKPILEKRCELSGCHLNAESPIGFSEFGAVSQLIQSGSFKSRVLIHKTMPPGKPLSDKDFQFIRCWIENNSPNN